MSVTAFADDIAVVLNNLFQQLLPLIVLFMRWKAASALQLNIVKCCLLPLWRYDHDYLRAWLHREVPEFAACAIDNSYKYLGIAVGPAAVDAQWPAVCAKVLARAADAALLTNGFCAKLRHFRLHGVTTIMYKAQFAALSNDLLKT